jgi:hypothetical protein
MATLALSLVASALLPEIARTQSWQPVAGEAALRSIFTDTVFTWKNDVGEYCADGTGTVFAWGESFPRTWEVVDDRRVCIISPDGRVCNTFEQDTTNPARYRVRDHGTDERTIVTLSYRQPRTCPQAVDRVEPASDWIPVKGEGALRVLFADTVVTRTNVVGEYCADGTGVVIAWGERFPRSWSIQSDEVACVSSSEGRVCYSFERHATDGERFRARDVETGNRDEIELSYREPSSCPENR